MKILLNDKKLDNDYSELTLPQILNNIKRKLDKKIVKKIIINEVEVNERYLEKSLIDKDDINKINFITQSTVDLTKETLNEIDSYLPKLRTGSLKTVELFRNGDLKQANNKLQLIFDGLNWYTQSTQNIVNLLDNVELQNDLRNKLLSLNKFLEEIYKAQANDDNILIADILEFEIIDSIDEFIFLNNKITNLVEEESDNS